MCRSPAANIASCARRIMLLVRGGDYVAALEAARAAAAMFPTSAQVQTSLGQIVYDIVVYDHPNPTNASLAEAEAAVRVALAHSDSYVPAHFLAASLYSALGRPREALAAAERAVALRPQEPHFATLHASLEGAVHGPERAAVRLAEIVTRFPRYAIAWADYAKTLRELDRSDEALAAAHVAVQCAPGDAAMHLLAATCLQTLGRHQEAFDTLERALGAVNARPAVIACRRAVLLKELGRLSEAAGAYEEALALEPGLAEAWYGRVELPQTPARAADVDAIERILDAAPTARAAETRVAFHFTAARTALRYGDGERAFRHFHAGNALKRGSLSYDIDAVERTMQTIAHLADRAFLEKAALGDRSPVPIFVLGMPRSGTTLVEQVLGAHPAVHPAGELSYLPQAIATLPVEPGAADIAASAQRYLRNVRALAPQAQRIVDKLPGNFLYAGFIHALFPQARIIHCRRDPLDTCVSCYTTLFSTSQHFSYDLVELGRFYRAYHALMAHWREVLPADRFTEIDYEAVVDDLEGNARRLIDFCGLPWDEACLRFHAARTPVRTASSAQVRRAIYRTSVGRGAALRRFVEPLVRVLGDLAPAAS